MQLSYRRYLTAAVALIGAGVIAVTTAPPPDVQVPDIQLTAGDEQDIVIDIVRHGQRAGLGGENVLTGSPDYPGVPLTDLGQQQAQDVGNQLFTELGGPDKVAGVFSGQAIRDMETAAPFATLEHMNVQILPGLDEIDSGIYAGDPIASLGGILYQLTAALWTWGFELVPIPGSGDFNGVVEDEKFTQAIDTMYNDAVADPVVSDNGQITDVAFNNEASVAAWTLMNVKNPDISILLPLFIKALSSGESEPFLANAGIVQVEGNPEDGWTLVSWNGQPIPQDPGLLTELLVDLRNLIDPPQTAAWNIFEAVLTGDPTTIENALQAGIQNVGAAIAQFPESVINDIVNEVQNLGNDVAAGETLADAFASAILGLA